MEVFHKSELKAAYLRSRPVSVHAAFGGIKIWLRSLERAQMAIDAGGLSGDLARQGALAFLVFSRPHCSLNIRIQKTNWAEQSEALGSATRAWENFAVVTEQGAVLTGELAFSRCRTAIATRDALYFVVERSSQASLGRKSSWKSNLRGLFLPTTMSDLFTVLLRVLRSRLTSLWLLMTILRIKLGWKLNGQN